MDLSGRSRKRFLRPVLLPVPIHGTAPQTCSPSRNGDRGPAVPTPPQVELPEVRGFLGRSRRTKEAWIVRSFSLVLTDASPVGTGGPCSDSGDEERWAKPCRQSREQAEGRGLLPGPAWPVG